jgi:hypothetical protein
MDEQKQVIIHKHSLSLELVSKIVLDLAGARE